MWWENSFLKVKDNKLYLDGREAVEIAEIYGTPLFVYGRSQVLSNYLQLREAISKNSSLEARIFYAMKANPHPGILDMLRSCDAWVDAVSPGEVAAAVRAGFPGERIIFTGTSISRKDLGQVFRTEGIIVNIDAEEQLELMRDVRDGEFEGKDIKVSVRWNPGIGRGFNPRVITAGKKSSDGTPIKFGVEEDKVIRAFQKARQYGFRPAGLHQHLGSGWTKKDFQTVKAAVDKMVRKASELEHEGFELEFLDFGGGFGPRYSRRQGLFPVKDYAEHILRQVDEAGLKIKAVAVEPGKYLVGDAGVLLLRVEYIKESYGNIFACVNGGTFTSVPRPAIYSRARHEIVHCSEVESPRKERITVAGNICETGDVFARERLMPVPRTGDILAVLCAGAYCRSMASNFNLREIPREIIL